jgi:hypothetical protein
LTILITNGLIYKFWCALGEDVEIILWTKVQVSLGVLTSDHGNQNAEHSPLNIGIFSKFVLSLIFRDCQMEDLELSSNSGGASKKLPQSRSNFMS